MKLSRKYVLSRSKEYFDNQTFRIEAEHEITDKNFLITVTGHDADAISKWLVIELGGLRQDDQPHAEVPVESR